MPALAEAGYAVLVPDMRGYGDSDKPEGTTGYDARALAEEFRALVQVIGFGGGKPMTLVAHDMGAPPALLWCADHPDEIAGLVYIEEPVMLSELLSKIIVYTPKGEARGSMWWWLSRWTGYRSGWWSAASASFSPGSTTGTWLETPSNQQRGRNPAHLLGVGREYWARWACTGRRSPPWSKRRN